MNSFITKKKLTEMLAEELAYLQIRADWWYYCFPRENVAENIARQDMSSSELELVIEVKAIATRLNILSQVYEKAYNIYDFRNSGKDGFEPDTEYIEKLNREFCEPMKKNRPFM